MGSLVEESDALDHDCIGCGQRVGRAHDLLCRRRSIGNARPHHVHAARVLARELGYAKLAELVETLASEEPAVQTRAA